MVAGGDGVERAMPRKKQVLIGHSVIHYARVLAGLDQPQTQTTAAEREVLASFLPGAKRVVEIGVFEGFTTRMLAERADRDAVIYGIDPFFSGRLGISWGERIARSYNGRASGERQDSLHRQAQHGGRRGRADAGRSRLHRRRPLGGGHRRRLGILERAAAPRGESSRCTTHC